MTKRVLKLIALVMFLRASGSTIADPGNVVSWFSNNFNELTFTCQTAVVKLELLDTHVARVRQSAKPVAFSAHSSFTVVRDWPRPPMTVIDKTESLLVTNAGLQIDVQKSPFRLTYRTPDGTVLLSDTNTLGLACQTDGRSANFLMPASEQYYGLGLSPTKSLSHRGQKRVLYNRRVDFQSGVMTDMAVPLMVSSGGYGVFVDNTFPQEWDFSRRGETQWQVTVRGGELDYYFIAGQPAEVLDQYTQMTGRAPLPPRWTLGYLQSKFGYRNWAEVFAAKDAFRSNDLPCDGLVLDLYWFGNPCDMGALRWDTNHFPNAAKQIAALAAAGIQLMAIHEPYFNAQHEPAKSNYIEARERKLLMTDDYPARKVPSLLEGFFCRGGYLDFNNPAARGWLFEKLRPIIDDGIAAHWTDLGEPEVDDVADYSHDGRREQELHNVQNLLWHRALAEGYATNFPNQRLYILSRSGFAGDQRFGAAHWTNDTGADWPTLAAHLNALANYGLSGLSYFGSDIGGFTGLPSDELYIRWFQFGAFCPAFRAHGVDKPTAPYEYSKTVANHCRAMLKLRYRLLPYIYNAARETAETGLPICRALPLAFPGDTVAQTNSSEFMFGPGILVAPVVTPGAATREVYLPAGQWIDHWTGQQWNGPRTLPAYPAPLPRIPLFYRDNSIVPLGPDLASTQFDDGTQRALRVYCSTNAAVTLYEDDGISRNYQGGAWTQTSITAASKTNSLTIQIGRAQGSFSGQPSHRAWDLEVFHTNAVAAVIVDERTLDPAGYSVGSVDRLLRVKLPAAPVTQPRVVTIYFDRQRVPLDAANPM